MFNDFSRFAESNAAVIADAVPVGIVITNSLGNLVFVNAELERMTGYERGDLLGQSVDLLLPERFRAVHVSHREGYVAAPSQRHMGEGRELYARRRDGSEFPVEVGLRPMETTAGRMTVACVIDVSARRRMEDSFRAIVDVMPNGMLTTDALGRITMANQNLCAMFGYGKEELLGQPIEMLLPERHRVNHVPLRDGFSASPSKRLMGVGRDLTGLRKDGREMPVEIGLTSIMTESGPMTLAAVVDITMRKRAELKLREANAQLEEFTYVSSHDLRAPIRGIVTLLDWIKEDLGSAASEAVITNMGRMASRLARMDQLIGDLLNYARSGRRSTKTERIDLADLAAEIVELEPAPEGMKLSMDLCAQTIEGARIPLQTVLRNLYSNAIKHHDKPDGHIAIQAREVGSYCVISVIDDGPGIPESAQGRVFRLFQTLTTAERKGSGLGLAVAKRLTESHGGRIELTSVAQKPGCIFEVWWPKFMRSDLDD
jgi:PAS domain S-box-containing protein